MRRAKQIPTSYSSQYKQMQGLLAKVEFKFGQKRFAKKQCPVNSDPIQDIMLSEVDPRQHHTVHLR